MSVSIIIPVYNVRQSFIAQCLESVFNQTSQDWEAIIIDDGSNAECSAYLDTFTSERIIVHHQKNAGVSVARNKGIGLASKEWIMFLDPDDWMAPTELEELLDLAKRYNADWVVGNSFFVKGENHIPGSHRYAQEIELIKPDGVIELMLELVSPMRYQAIYRKSLGGFLRTPWAKLFRRRIVQENHILFPEGIHPSEDTLYNIRYLEHCERVVLSDACLHYYRTGEGGVMSKYKSTWVKNNGKAKEIAKAFVAKNLGGTGHEDEWRNFCIILLKEIMKLQVFHPQSPLSNKEKIELANEIIDQDIDYKNAVRSCWNRLYTPQSRLFATMMRFKTYRMLELLYRIK